MSNFKINQSITLFDDLNLTVWVMYLINYSEIFTQSEYKILSKINLLHTLKIY